MSNSVLCISLIPEIYSGPTPTRYRTYLGVVASVISRSWWRRHSSPWRRLLVGVQGAQGRKMWIRIPLAYLSCAYSLLEMHSGSQLSAQVG